MGEITEATAIQLVRSMRNLNTAILAATEILRSRGVSGESESSVPDGDEWKVFVVGMVIGELITILLLIIGLILFSVGFHP